MRGGTVNKLENSHQSRGRDLDEENLVTELKQALQETLFSSGLRISPRRVSQMAQAVAASFLQFLEREDQAATRAYGQELAQAGLGHPSALALTEALRRACWENTNPGTGLLPVSGRYVGALLQGYMEEREASILREQERTAQALQRALNRTT